VNGSVRLDGQEILGAAPATLDRVRGGRIATIFQDPASSLNPVHRIGRQIAEALRCTAAVRRAAREEARRLLDGSACPMRAAASTPTRTSCPAARTSA
jgi:peptide/nickel transport system ATP-binding protein